MAEATGLILNVAQTLLSALQTKELRELCSSFDFGSQLADLQRTVETINAVLLDADSKHQELNNQGKDWLGKLKDAVYDADDLFDEFNTVAEQQKRLPGGKIFRKVRRFFSSENQLLFAVKMSRKIKNLKKELNSIAEDRSKHGFKDVYQPVYQPVKKREESISYVYEPDIIGREADKEAILGLLLRDSDVENNHVSFVSIVGIGGLGKTALAQLLFNDNKIRSAFELSLWVCVSEEFGLKEILLKMLGKSTNERNLEELQKEARRKIEGKRYFLVLDDVWEEDRNAWATLRSFLLLGARGSRVMITTRSKKVARATGDDLMHVLEGLSDENSWCLFKNVAFNQGSKQIDDALVEIGKSIVKKCANVPLSIKITGSMLYDQDKSKWLLFQRTKFANMGQGDIMPILKFSYYHLTPQLKTCFSYCALFPKDYNIRKEFLLNLWLAEGCLEGLYYGQNIEDVGEEYFSILLQRCFFQDIEKDDYGEICRFKIHDLIHDLARDVVGKELCLATNSSSGQFYEKIRHFSSFGRFSLLPCPSDAWGKLRSLWTMRTFLRPSSYDGLYWDSIILANCKRLRVLDLHCLMNETLGKTLSNTLNNLSHLRYLDLSDNYFNLEKLPESISKLHNLQVLDLRSCRRLEKLPTDLKELVNLRHLYLTDCSALTHMPAGMDSLIDLRTLTMFVVGEGSSNQVQKGQLKDLMPLVNLRGELQIKFRCYPFGAIGAEEGAYLVNKTCLKTLAVVEEHIRNRRYFKEHNLVPVIVDKRLLECLKPHCDLRGIEIMGYKDNQLPGWAAALVTYLPLLVRISLWCFTELQHLPQLSQLRHLKVLELYKMPNVEYMEDDNGDILFFPSLEKLVLNDFAKLKGWWRSKVGVVGRGDIIPVFSRILELEILDCPNLASFPGCPVVKNLELYDIKEPLTFCRKREETCQSHSQTPLNAFSSLSSTPLSSSINTPSEIVSNNKPDDDFIYLDSLQINNMVVFNLFFGESLLSVAERFSSIQRLSISEAYNTKSLRGVGIEHLTNLHFLHLSYCHDLELEEEEDGMPWKALYKLIRLNLIELPKVVNLPKGMQYLSSLQRLCINGLNLEVLPEWLHHLTCLEKLEILLCLQLKSLPEAISRIPSLILLRIVGCDELEKRCQKPDGEDWHKICHIPNLSFESC